MNRDRFTIIAAVNNRRILEGNLLLSPALADGHERNILIKEGFSSASLAYNSAMEEAKDDILVFVHQDVYLPEHWFSNVSRAIQTLEENGIRWGVLGCFGLRRGVEGGLGMVFTTGRGLHGKALHAPEQVDTLDEIVLIFRKSTGLKFDPNLPYFHMYGVDICLQAKSFGMTNYAIPAFCVHNTNQLVKLPAEFYACYSYIKRKWPKDLPIHTSCMTVTHFDAERREKQIKDFIKTALGRMKTPLSRAEDPRTLLATEDWNRLTSARGFRNLGC
jgi:hypothetical protein